MCIVCVQWDLGKLTNKDAFRNLGEMIRSAPTQEERDHLVETYEKILDDEVKLEPIK